MATIHKPQPFTIELFYVDGDPNGTIRAKRENLTSVVFRIPRAEFEAKGKKSNLRSVEGIKSPGIYFLFAKESKKEFVYIGQASKRSDNEDFVLFNRVREHIKGKKKEFFKEVFFYTTEGRPLGSTDLNYLERKFYEIAKSNPRFQVENKLIPSQGHVRDSERSNLNGLIEESKLLFECLHFNFFKEPEKATLSERQELVTKEGHYSYINSRLHFKANLDVIDGKYILLKGSEINFSPVGRTPIPKSVKQKRDSLLLNNEVILNKSGSYVLQKDLVCGSPSEAASIAAGYLVSGKVSWKDSDGNSLRENEKEEVKLESLPSLLQEENTSQTNLLTFILKNKNHETGIITVATMLSNNSKFIVKEGSNILFVPGIDKNLRSTLKKKREYYLQNGDIKLNKSNQFVLQTDLEFTSPSACGEFVLGRPVDGRITWKTLDVNFQLKRYFAPLRTK